MVEMKVNQMEYEFWANGNCTAQWITAKNFTNAT